MELVIPYLLIIFGIPAEDEGEIVKRQLTISEESCRELLKAERSQWIDDDGQAYHLVCMRLPEQEEFAALFSEES
ncbi:MAG: hypothetical protein ABJ239_10960 [Erythrobacter sp.]